MFIPNELSTLDTAAAEKTVFTTEPRFAVYGRERLAGSKRSIVLVGASNVREGFRPSELAEHFSNFDIHNIAVGASDMRQLRELVQLVLSAVPNERREDLTIVLGIWYGSFVDENRRWKGGPTDVGAEMLRYGLYRENGSELPIARFNAAQFPYAVAATRPFMLASRMYLLGISKRLDAIKNYLMNTLSVSSVSIIDINFDNHIVNQEEQERATIFWKEYMGLPVEWSEEGFDTLYAIASEVSSAGANLVLVDMPIPNWHRSRVPYDRIYQERLVPRLAKMSLLTGFSYGSMRENISDTDYYDSAHPRPKITHQWASRVAQIIEPVLEKK